MINNKGKNVYEIKIPHYYCLEYFEQGKRMTVDIDFREDIIYLETYLIGLWDPPNEEINISIEDKRRILLNIYDGLISMGFKRKNVKLNLTI